MIKQVLECVHQNHWFTSIYLKDAYFHVLIIHKHRTFLCFFLPRSSVPEQPPAVWVLARLPHILQMRADGPPLRIAGMRVLFYQDELLLLAGSKEEAEVQTRTLATLLSNWAERELTYSIPAHCLSEVVLNSVTALSAIFLLGITSARVVVPLVLLMVQLSGAPRNVEGGPTICSTAAAACSDP